MCVCMIREYVRYERACVYVCKIRESVYLCMYNSTNTYTYMKCVCMYNKYIITYIERERARERGSAREREQAREGARARERARESKRERAANTLRIRDATNAPGMYPPPHIRERADNTLRIRDATNAPGMYPPPHIRERADNTLRIRDATNAPVCILLLI
jgi:hypothetical protein